MNNSDRRRVLVELAGVSAAVAAFHIEETRAQNIETIASNVAPLVFSSLAAANAAARSVDGADSGTVVYVAGFRRPGDGGSFLGTIAETERSEFPQGGRISPLPGPGATLPAAAWGVLPAEPDVGVSLQKVIDVAISERRPVILPSGSLTIKTPVLKNYDGDLHLASAGGTRLQLQNTSSDLSVRFGSRQLPSLTLATDARRGQSSIKVTTTNGLAIGDLIHLKTKTVPQNGYGYFKQCVRRISAVVDDQICLDQRLEWDFMTAEGALLDVWRPGRLIMDDIAVAAASRRAMQIDCLVGTRITGCDFIGPGPGWRNDDWGDCLIINACDDTILEHCTFARARYLPNITNGSRRTTIRFFTATEVRHMDANSWAEDTVIEDGRGIATDGLIQSHPSIRTTIRRVTDSVTRTGLFGLDMRGLGDVVEDCSSNNVNGVKGCNTNGPIMKPEYKEMAREFTRHIRRFRSSTAGISCRHHGALVVEGCEVPFISLDGPSFYVGQVEVDATTRTTDLNNINRVARHIQARESVNVVPSIEGDLRIIEIALYPAVGSAPVCRYRSTIYQETRPSSASHTFPVRIHTNSAEAVRRGVRHGKLTARALTEGGMAELVQQYRLDPAGGVPIVMQTVSNAAAEDVKLTLGAAKPHFAAEIRAEGGNGWTQGRDHYWAIEISVALSGRSRTLRRLEIEIEEWT
jgi:hypothetical protein